MAAMVDRFNAKVDRSGECHVWTRGTALGYGRFRINGRTFLSHRVAFEMVNGEIPPGKLILHRCNNRLCVNPDHLYAGTHSDNRYDAVAAGAWINQNYGATHCKYGHEFTDENTYVHSKRGTRHCKTCQRRRVGEYRSR